MKMFLKFFIFIVTFISVTSLNDNSVQAKSKWQKGTPTALRGYWKNRAYVYNGHPRGHWEYTYMYFLKSSAGFYKRYGTDIPGIGNVQYRKLGQNFYKLYGGFTWYKRFYPSVWYINKLSTNKLVFNGHIFYKWDGHTRINKKIGGYPPIW